jgi:hypothetical protein
VSGCASLYSMKKMDGRDIQTSLCSRWSRNQIRLEEKKAEAKAYYNWVGGRGELHRRFGETEDGGLWDVE